MFNELSYHKQIALHIIGYNVTLEITELIFNIRNSTLYLSYPQIISAIFVCILHVRTFRRSAHPHFTVGRNLVLYSVKPKNRPSQSIQTLSYVVKKTKIAALAMIRVTTCLEYLDMSGNLVLYSVKPKNRPSQGIQTLSYVVKKTKIAGNLTTVREISGIY